MARRHESQAQYRADNRDDSDRTDAPLVFTPEADDDRTEQGGRR